MNEQDLKGSIIIVIQPDGGTEVRIPKDETLEFSSGAYTQFLNTLTVIGNPSYLLLSVLWFERKLGEISSILRRKTL
jgi:hypothetical protein